MNPAPPPDEAEPRDHAMRDDERRVPSGRLKRVSIGLALAVAIMLAAALAYGWITRERIAANLIEETLASSQIETRYTISDLSPTRQVFKNIEVGKKGAADLTIKRLTLVPAIGWQGPYIDKIIVEGLILRGSLSETGLSLGALDRLLESGSDEAAGLPNLALDIRDGGAVFSSPAGAMGLAFSGSGNLQDGFAGTLAASAPGLAFEGCSARALTFYGEVETREKSAFVKGPLRLQEGQCDNALIARADTQIELGIAPDLASARGTLNLDASGLSAAGFVSKSASVTGTFNISASNIAFDHEAVLRQTTYKGAGIELERLAIDGALRSGGDLSRTDWAGSVAGKGIGISPALLAPLADLQQAASGTLAADLAAKLERGLKRNLTGAQARGEFALRLGDERLSIAVPTGYLETASGERIASLSRLSFAREMGAQGEAGRLSGNFITSGADLPQITGRIEQSGNAGMRLRARMAEFVSATSTLAIPRLTVQQKPGGELGFDGLMIASGPLIEGEGESEAAGAISGLELALSGEWSGARGLLVGQSCQQAGFSRLRLASLTIDANRLALCPTKGAAAMLAYNDALQINIETGPLTLAGTLADTPSQIDLAGLRLAYPGRLKASGLAASFGPPGNTIALGASSVTADLDKAGGGQIVGAFEGGTAQLAAVPLDLDELAGRWIYEGGVLAVSDALLRVQDRIKGQARFEPVTARGASLKLADNIITASAQLRHPPSDTPLGLVEITHDLGKALGDARFIVDDLTFGDDLAPDDLTYLTRGIITLVKGAVSGEGRFSWQGDTIQSSGIFATRDLDLAAAFGPVEGLSTSVEFTDLLNLTTAPSQLVEIGSINPGIEVLGGALRFSLQDGEIIEIEKGRWPFVGGELIIRPVTLRYGEEGENRYTFEMVGLDAAKFVAQMELTNIGATGVFDGTVPIVFDAQGNGRIEGGVLISRPPGGNVSYIGELTYEDLGTISNYAFQALRSLDYTQMLVGLEGDLAGEIITSFQFDGVRQGEGAQRNFITRRLAALPIRFKINVRSQNFYELATMVRTFWDADYLPDPVDQGVLGASDGRFVPPKEPAPDETPPPRSPETLLIPQSTPNRPNEASVQPLERELLP